MMKPLLFLFTLFMAGSALQAQIYADDFEAYPENALIAQASPNWNTWSVNGAGTSEDAPVSTEQAFSGDKSLKLFNTNPAGGPMDVILPFGQSFNEGTFTLGMKLYVVAGTGAYFNFQANQVIGQIWAADFFFRQTGVLEINTGNVNQSVTNFAHNTWIDVLCVFDLSNNVWQVLIDGEEVASFSNNNNRVASLNLYPYNPSGNSTFFVDDIFFDHKPFEQLDLDLAVFGVSTRNRNMAGRKQPIEITLRNLGLETIESVDIHWTDGINTYTEEVPEFYLESGQNFTFTHLYELEVLPGASELTVFVTNINGGGDNNPDNDERRVTVTGVVPAADKKVMAEEATGTWCVWCPRGTVFMEFMEHEYRDYFVPVAVHNNDPMANAVYNAGVTSFPGFTGFPGVIMDRTLVIDPSQLENNFFNQITSLPAATLFNGAAYDANTGELTISVTVDVKAPIFGNWRLNVAITEDGIKGSGSGYAQANAYAGGGNGPMGGFENLPNPVPAALMTYNQVARAILGGFAGQAGSLTLPAPAGSSQIHTFTYSVPSNVNPDNIHIISMLINPNGRINNANTFTFQEALANGLASSSEEPVSLQHLDIYPNPANEQTMVHLHLSETRPVRLEVLDMLGRPVYQQTFGDLAGEHWLTLPTHQFGNGLYTLRIHSGNGFAVRKLAVQH